MGLGVIEEKRLLIRDKRKKINTKMMLKIVLELLRNFRPLKIKN